MFEIRQPRFTDLDERPDLGRDVLQLFRRFGPGRFHAVHGEPSRMGQEVGMADLEQCLGVLICLDDSQRPAGALGICSYSSNQVTLWGPVIASGHQGQSLGRALLLRAKDALRDGGFESIRVLNDTRNRRGRNFYLSNGLSPWQDNHVYEHLFEHPPYPFCPGVSLAKHSDHQEVSSIIHACFPDSSHCDVSLVQREREGYRHYILQIGGDIIGIAAINGLRPRSWMSLYGIHPHFQGQGHGKQLLAGIVHHEHELGCRSLGLEVLARNRAAIALYERAGFQRRWTASILVGPL